MRNSTADDYMFSKSDEAMGKTAVFPALHHAAKQCVDRPASGPSISVLSTSSGSFSRTDRAEA
jgi:hypothetical protein